MLERIKAFQKCNAQNNDKKKRKRGKIDLRHIKLQYQNTTSKGKIKRKTRNYSLFSQQELDFPDANNLLRKKLVEYEFDNDAESDEDEIAKSSYVRLKDLTICLKEQLDKGHMYDDDDDDRAIKKHYGLAD
mmetsp:Transcript_32599/g.28860  ORF Transcript_32599/g.28860 Transcript_32599/m.28860 type:complete len:131 (-) Transcript_32599:76-468(-)